jgi:FkbM family methyltransferase
MFFKSSSDIEAEIFKARMPRMIFDVGACRGEMARDFLRRYPGTRLVAFEPEPENARHALEVLAPHRDRATLEAFALSDRSGTVRFHVNSHHGTHSLHEIGAQRYWAGHAEARDTIEVRTATLDDYCAQNGIHEIDILKLDTQGSELSILRGASLLLSTGRIAMIRCEVEIYPLYSDQPLFHDILAWLNRFGYKLAGVHDPYYHAKNPVVLCWFDATFVAPRLTGVPEWERDRA